MASTRFSLNDAGFTIIEALIALAIFSIGLMAVGALQARSLMATGDVARRTEAWTLADQRAELLKPQRFYVDYTTATFPPDLIAGAHDDSGAPMDPRYTVHWLVEDDQPIGQQNETVLPGVVAGTYTVAKRITVAVTLPGGNPVTDALAQVQFVKVWWATGIP